MLLDGGGAAAHPASLRGRADRRELGGLGLGTPGRRTQCLPKGGATMRRRFGAE